MGKLHQLAISISTAVLLAACGGGSDNDDPEPEPEPENDNLTALSCSGNRIWDFGDSDVLDGALSYLSETNGDTLDSRFPCTAVWEYHPTINCSLSFSYEDWLTEFGVPDGLQNVGTSGVNLVTVDTEGGRLTGTPAGISITDLRTLPDCILE